MINSVLVTGANRGIGLQFVKDFLKFGVNKANSVIATYRDPSTLNELDELAKSNRNLSVLQLDIKNYSGYNEFRDKVSSIVGDKGLTLLINNAGIASPTNFNSATVEKLVENFEVNAVTPLMLSRALLPLLKQSSKSKNRTIIANISSIKASVGDNTTGSFYAYRASKTALNQISKCMSIDLAPHKIEVTMIHPGWVKTRLGTAGAPMTTDQTVPMMINLLLDESNKINGKFLNYDGKEIPW